MRVRERARELMRDRERGRELMRQEIERGVGS